MLVARILTWQPKWVVSPSSVYLSIPEENVVYNSFNLNNLRNNLFSYL